MTVEQVIYEIEVENTKYFNRYLVSEDKLPTVLSELEAKLKDKIIDLKKKDKTTEKEDFIFLSVEKVSPSTPELYGQPVYYKASVEEEIKKIIEQYRIK